MEPSGHIDNDHGVYGNKRQSAQKKTHPDGGCQRQGRGVFLTEPLDKLYRMQDPDRLFLSRWFRKKTLMGPGNKRPDHKTCMKEGEPEVVLYLMKMGYSFVSLGVVNGNRSGEDRNPSPGGTDKDFHLKIISSAPCWKL